jgi:hypothetical protein
MAKQQILRVKTKELQAKMVKNRNLFCDFPYQLQWFGPILPFPSGLVCRALLFLEIDLLEHIFKKSALLI